MEVEVKYSIDDDTKVSSILEDEFLSSIECEDTRKTLSMHATYYDTVEMELEDRKAAFRIRLEGDDYVATVKMGGSVNNGVHERFELNKIVEEEDYIENPTLDLFMDDETIKRNLGDLAGKEILPILEMNYVRELFEVEFQGSRMEVALDQGDIWTPEGNAPICEMEIEIISGDVDDLKQLGGIVSREYDLEIERRSKFERGITIIDK